MGNGEVERLAKMLSSAQRHLTEELERLTDEEVGISPGENEWTAAKICAHVIESHLMRLHKVANIVEQPDVSRTPLEMERRLSTVAKHADDTLGIILYRLRNACDEAIGILHGLGTEHLAAKDNTGVSGREIVEMGIVGHVEEHARQLRDVRCALKG